MPLVAVVCVEASWDSGRLSVETGVGVTVGDEATDFVVNGPWVAVSLLELELAAGAGRTAVDCVVDCAAPEEVSVGGRETPVDEVAVVDPFLEQDAEIMLTMYRGEAIQFSQATWREEQSEAMFEGNGSVSFYAAAAACLQTFLYLGGTHSSYVVAPSENSPVWGERGTNWSDQDAIACFQRQSNEDFYVSRVPNFSDLVGEPILPEQ